jgi:hypothetical protein
VSVLGAMAYNIAQGQADQYPRGGVPVDFPEATAYNSPSGMQFQQTTMPDVGGMNQPVVSCPAFALFRLAFLTTAWFASLRSPLFSPLAGFLGRPQEWSSEEILAGGVCTRPSKIQGPILTSRPPLICQAGYLGQQSRDMEAGKLNSTLVYNNNGAPHAVRLLPNHVRPLLTILVSLSLSLPLSYTLTHKRTTQGGKHTYISACTSTHGYTSKWARRSGKKS